MQIYLNRTVGTNKNVIILFSLCFIGLVGCKLYKNLIIYSKVIRIYNKRLLISSKVVSNYNKRLLIYFKVVNIYKKRFLISSKVVRIYNKRFLISSKELSIYNKRLLFFSKVVRFLNLTKGFGQQEGLKTLKKRSFDTSKKRGIKSS